MSVDERHTDFELLRRYASEGSEEAFAALVKSYASLVYSAALRQVGDTHAAEEVAQVVFVILARKAAGLPKQTILPSWLWRTTRFVALNTVRKEIRRRQTEQEAAAFYQTETEQGWMSLAPRLDQALDELGTKDRDAVILRFFEHKSLRQIAQQLGTSEDGAQKRVSRALERLRMGLNKQGVALSATVIAGSISAKALHAAPAGFASVLARGSFLKAGQAASTASKMITTLDEIKGRTLALQAGGVAVMLLLGWLLFRFYEPSNGTPSIAVGPNAVPVAQQPPAAALPGNAVAVPAAQANVGRVRLLVLDGATRRPVPNAQLSVQWRTVFPNTRTNLLSTDPEGQAILEYDAGAEERWNLLVVILKPGYVPKFVSWSAARGDILEELPADYTTTLERGTVAGGTVVDQQGEPIADAQVLIDDARPEVSITTPAEREGIALTHSETTDTQGRWLCDHLPGELGSVHFAFRHPEYQAVTAGCAQLGATTNQGMSYLAEADLHKQTAILRLQRGLEVSGTVMDATGRPLPGAQVIRNRAWWDPAAGQTTDDLGRFRFADLWPGQLILTARAEGFLETDRVIQVTGLKRDIRLELPRAATLLARVSDGNGNAVAQACISATGENYRDGKHDWSAVSDQNGRFQWRSAPPIQTNYQISAWGYKTTNVVLIPNGVEQQVVLQSRPPPKLLRVAGLVRETTSRKPVEQFEVWVATTLGPHGPSHYPAPVGLAPELKTTGTNGSFSFLSPENYADPVVRLEIEIRAEGYLPAKQTLPGPLTRRTWLEFDLAPTTVLAGSLQLPDGGAAAGAVVLLAQPNAGRMGYMQLPGQFDLQLSSAPHAQTDNQGSFTLPAKVMSGILLAAHPEGFVCLDLNGSAPSATIRLQPWGRIVGTLRVHNGPGSNRAVHLGTDYEATDEPSPFLLTRTVPTDASGRFVMEAVPPGDWRLEPHHERIRVVAGETLEVQLGGGGVKVSGRVTLKNPIRPDDLKALTVALNTKMFEMPTPRREQFGTFQEYSSAKNHWFTQQSEFRRSPAGRAARRNSRSYTVKLEKDGSFFIEEVLPGTYELSITGDPLRFDSVQMAFLSDALTDVVVPPPQAGQPDAVDVGVVEVDLARR